MRSFVALLALSFAAGTGAYAQEPAVQAQDTLELRDALSRAEARNWTVRASLMDRSVLEGRINAVRRDAYEIGVKPLPLDQVQKLALLMREGGGGMRGFMFGAVAGTTVIYRAGQGLNRGEGGLGLLVVSAFLGSLLGGVPGALVGSSIDPPTIHWVPFWP